MLGLVDAKRRLAMPAILILLALALPACGAAGPSGENGSGPEIASRESAPENGSGQEVASREGASGERGDGAERERDRPEEHAGDTGERVEVPRDDTLWLTIPEMERVENAEVPNATYDDERSLKEHTAIHVHSTGYPWQEEANVYIAGHRLGYPSTGSFLAFYDLPELENGDEITVTDANGTEYVYEVFDELVADPTGDLHLLEPVPGKNILTLQTCTLPDYSKRIIVRAELKES